MTTWLQSPGCDRQITATVLGASGGTVERSTMSRERSSSLVPFLKDFRLQCQALAAKDNAGYRLEFEWLCEVGKELNTRIGDLGINREKNRYPYILPYDHSRVKLTPQNSDPHSDYINANYVPGGVSQRDFICTQGPLRSTQADFWRMVWEQNVHMVVMVTNCKENDKVLCERYWPQDHTPQCYGRYQVTTLRHRRGPSYLLTTMRLHQMDGPTERKITHYHYLGWPDRGVPRDLASFCFFTEYVRWQLDSTPQAGPAVVHCSAGVGRSGTFVALLSLMQMCVRGTQPDVRGTVYNLRMHRVMMVQTLEQYIFVHSCLLHWMTEEMTRYKPRFVESSWQMERESSRQMEREKDSRMPTPEAPPPHSYSKRKDKQRHHRLPPTLAPTGIQRLLSVNLLQRVQTPSSPGMGWGVGWNKTLPPQTKLGWSKARGFSF